MPDWMSMERTRIMESYGATVVPVSREQGGFLGSIRMTEELAAGGGVFCRGSSQTAPMSRRTSRPPGLKSGCNLESSGLCPMPLWPAWARAAP